MGATQLSESMQFRRLSTLSGWTSSKSLVTTVKKFEQIVDCTLTRSELAEGVDGGGGLRVRPLILKEMGGSASSFNLYEESSFCRG